MEKSNQEKKQKIWEQIKKKYKHLEQYCEFECLGLEDDSIYFHPKFVIGEGVFIRTQCDINNSKATYMYAYWFHYDNNAVEIDEFIFENIIVGYSVNQEKVFKALDTLKKVNEHASKIRDYTYEYVKQIILGDSLNEISREFINEIKTTTLLIDEMKK